MYTVAVCACLWLFAAATGCHWLSLTVSGCLTLSVGACGCRWLLIAVWPLAKNPARFQHPARFPNLPGNLQIPGVIFPHFKIPRSHVLAKSYAKQKNGLRKLWFVICHQHHSKIEHPENNSPKIKLEHRNSKPRTNRRDRFFRYSNTPKINPQNRNSNTG